ncbi:MAG: hypothetical protein IH627_12760 [Rubrivivax sp.]|nr:hypothetical protein [Rubrivivax sp.]
MRLVEKQFGDFRICGAAIEQARGGFVAGVVVVRTAGGKAPREQVFRDEALDEGWEWPSASAALDFALEVGAAAIRAQAWWASTMMGALPQASEVRGFASSQLSWMTRERSASTQEATAVGEVSPLRLDLVFDDRYFMASNELNLLNTLLLAKSDEPTGRAETSEVAPLAEMPG